MPWKCNDCGEVFDAPYEYEERDVNYFADWCPYCHSDDIVEVKECELCGKLTPVFDLTIDGFCPECVEKAAKKYDQFLKSCEPEELKIFREQFGIEPINY